MDEPALAAQPRAESARTPLDSVRRRTLAVLSAGQVLGGISFGATVSLGALLAAEISGDDSLSGLATAAITFGTALTAVPLAALARRRGRRPTVPAGRPCRRSPWRGWGSCWRR